MASNSDLGAGTAKAIELNQVNPKPAYREIKGRSWLNENVRIRRNSG